MILTDYLLTNYEYANVMRKAYNDNSPSTVSIEKYTDMSAKTEGGLTTWTSSSVATEQNFFSKIQVP